MLIFPNCKINIGLQILNKRIDGYHAIETLLVPVKDLRDIIEIKESKDFAFYCTGIDSTYIYPNNLCVKAYNLLKQVYHLPPVCIYLHKCIPIGAGLGGGSADAAFVLLLLDKLFKLDLTPDLLKTYAQKLGSDCAFFIENKPALGVEKGNVLFPIEVPALKGKYIYIIKPSVHIKTAKAYELVKPKLPDILLRELITLPIVQWKDTVVNDFEKIICEHYPVLQKIKPMLYQQNAIYASMSGSGSSFYGIFKEKPDFNKNLPADYFQWIGKL